MRPGVGDALSTWSRCHRAGRWESTAPDPGQCRDGAARGTLPEPVARGLRPAIKQHRAADPGGDGAERA